MENLLDGKDEKSYKDLQCKKWYKKFKTFAVQKISKLEEKMISD